MRKMVIVLCVAFATTLLAGSTAANAQVAPCTTPTQAKFDLPLKVAYGRAVPMAIPAEMSAGLGSVLTVTAADPAQPISHPFTENSPSFIEPPMLQIDRGDGPALVTGTWDESDASTYYCQHAIASTVTGFAGVKPEIRVHETKLNGFSVQAPTPGEKCDQVPKMPFSLEARSGSQRSSITIDDPCARGNNDRNEADQGPTWTLKSTGRTDGDAFELSAANQVNSGIGISFGNSKRTAVRLVRWTARLDGKVAKRGRFWMRTVRHPGYDIYEGTDDFINTCVNDTHNLYSRNGRLYCHISGYQDYDYFYDRKPRGAGGTR